MGAAIGRGWYLKAYNYLLSHIPQGLTTTYFVGVKSRIQRSALESWTIKTVEQKVEEETGSP
jgi:hypothetical protein